jgi:Restriction endonuclease fold toxin 5
LAEIRANPRLGAKMADWLAQNGERLVRHPQLQRPMQSSMHGSGPAGTGNAGSASAAPAPARTGRNTSTRQAEQGANPPLPPPLRPAAQMLGKTEGGPGVWAEAPRRAKGGEYQEQISGVTRGVEYAVPLQSAKRGEVLFDGFDAQRRVLLDAKDWRGFPPSDTVFWHNSTLIEARAQIDAAKGLPIEWHFSSEGGLQATRRLFNEQNIREINLVFTPIR